MSEELIERLRRTVKVLSEAREFAAALCVRDAITALEAAEAKGRSDLVTELLEVFIRPRPNGGVSAVMSAIRDAAKEKEGRNT